MILFPRKRLLLFIVAGCWLLASPSAYGLQLTNCHAQEVQQHVNTVKRARFYSRGGVGFANKRTDASSAFDCLMGLPRSQVMPHLDALIETENPAAQAYGFAGIRQRAPWAFRQRRDVFTGGDEILIWQSGCVGQKMLLSEFLGRIELSFR